MLTVRSKNYITLLQAQEKLLSVSINISVSDWCTVLWIRIRSDPKLFAEPEPSPKLL
jgi:hypothetical protein